MKLMILRTIKYNLHYDDVRGDVLRPSYSYIFKANLFLYLKAYFAIAFNLIKIFQTIHRHACLKCYTDQANSDLQGTVTVIIMPVRWASTRSGELCCQATAPL